MVAQPQLHIDTISGPSGNRDHWLPNYPSYTYPLTLGNPCRDGLLQTPCRVCTPDACFKDHYRRVLEGAGGLVCGYHTCYLISRVMCGVSKWAISGVSSVDIPYLDPDLSK